MNNGFPGGYHNGQQHGVYGQMHPNQMPPYPLPQGMQPRMQMGGPGMNPYGQNPNAPVFQPGQPYGNFHYGGMQPGYANFGGPYGGQAGPYDGYAQQAFAPQQQAAEPPPPSDEEQAWIEQQMETSSNNNTSQPPVELADTEDEPPTPTATPAATAPAEPGDYDDVMKLIEENRRKNEAKRAAQSARNAEIIAAFEQRQAGGGS